MSDYELKLTAEVSYGKEVGRQRHTIELEDSGITIYDFMEVLKSLTLSLGYSEELWKRAVVNMSDEYMAEFRSEDREDIILDDVDWNDETEYMIRNDHEHHVETKETIGVRGCPVTGHTVIDMNQYTNHAISEEYC